MAGLVTVVGLSGCSSGHATAQHGKPGSTVATTTVRSPQQLVLSGYAAAVGAIAEAELHNDPTLPQLLESLVNPELGHVQAFISTEIRLGYHSHGSVQIVSSRVTSYSPTSAQVEACIHDAVIAVDANGTPVPGNAGRVTYDVAKGTMVPAGSSWILQDGVDQQFATGQQGGPLCAS